MFKILAVAFAAILGVAFATPNPKAGVLAYGAPAVAYSSPIAYSAQPSLVSGYGARVVSAYGAAPVVSAYGAAPVVSAYGAAPIVSAYGAAPLAYSAYSGYGSSLVY